MNSRAQTDLVRAYLEAQGFKVRREVELGQGLWKGIRCDFVVDGCDAYPDGLAIECKWQTSAGSADEKIAYTVLNILERYPIPCLLVMSGSELEAALSWAKGKRGGRLVDAVSTDEFIAFVGAMNE